MSTRIAFIKDLKVTYIYPKGAIYKIMKRNLRKDWDTVIPVEDDAVQKGWIYDWDTQQLTAPEE